MEKMKFALVPDNGDSFDVVVDSRDILEWEETTKNANIATLAEKPSLVSFYKLAYLASVRLGKFDGTLEQFKKGYAIEMYVEVPDDENLVTPSEA